ncbi:MAG: hypothetical protein PHF21_02710 [Bacilli bacterium]|nr:hypothetical protein [Bacilli bacterium]
MKLLYKKEYIERTLFALEHNGKFITVYRSSGLSGTGHKDQILPFSSLSEHHTLSTCLGYIYKEMFYDGKWKSHYKRMDNFPGLEEKMQYLAEFLKNERADIEFELNEEDPFIIDKFTAYVKLINTDLAKVQGNMELFDLKEDF